MYRLGDNAPKSYVVHRRLTIDVAVEILSNYLHRRERNISLLMDYAKRMRVISTIQPYLEMGLYRL